MKISLFSSDNEVIKATVESIEFKIKRLNIIPEEDTSGFHIYLYNAKQIIVCVNNSHILATLAAFFNKLAIPCSIILNKQDLELGYGEIILINQRISLAFIDKQLSKLLPSNTTHVKP